MDTQPTPTNPVSPEQQPTGQTLESAVVVPTEAGTQAAAGSSAPVTVQPTLTADEVAAVIAATPTTGQPVAQAPVNPAEAADQDVIEPEWVEKAEQAVEQNAGNPYAEEEAIEDLQIDYLKKRYGHEVKKSEDK